MMKERLFGVVPSTPCNQKSQIDADGSMGMIGNKLGTLKEFIGRAIGNQVDLQRVG